MALPKKPVDTDIDPDCEALLNRVSQLEAEVEYLKEHGLSKEDIAYVKSAKLAAEHAGWAWQQIRVYTPWVISITSALGAGIYWILTHITFRHGGS